MNGAIYVSNSNNKKISGVGKVDATYASIKATCSDSCELKKTQSCYAMSSFVGMTVKRLDRKSRNYNALKLAKSEAKEIDNSYNGGKVPNGRMLRVHVSGDSKTIKGTKLINSAVARWKKRGGGLCWSYTHSWANVKRKHWKNVSILASIENVSQVLKVREQGYAPAIVVDHFDSDKAFSLKGCETKFIPCPAQTKEHVSCDTCKLCMKADWLYSENKGIAFSAHGIKQKSLKKHLKILQNTNFEEK